MGRNPLWLFVAKRLASFYPFKKVVVVASPEELEFYRYLSPFQVVRGGRERWESLLRGLEEVESEWVMVTDVARPLIPRFVVEKLIKVAEKGEVDSVVPYLPVVDTAVYRNKTIDRRELKLIQTPQLSKTAILREGLRKLKETGEELPTDDRGVVEKMGGEIGYIPGSPQLHKLTYFSDLRFLELPPPSRDYFTGIGYDVHRFKEGEGVKIGGVHFDTPFSFDAHSDGDLVIHVVIDALLGAATAGDIGELFPDTDPRYRGADSMELLRRAITLIGRLGFEPVNIDITYIGEVPRLKGKKWEMARKIGEVANCPVNVKATTNEKMGFIGRREGAGALAIATLKYKDWYEDSNRRK